MPGLAAHRDLVGEPLPCVEVLGRSVLERMIERLLRAGVEVISILAEAGTFCDVPGLRTKFERTTIEAVNDPKSAVDQKLTEYSQNGIEHAFVNSADAYAETDLLDLFYFHREARQAITHVFDRGGPLYLSVVDCGAKRQQPHRDVWPNEQEWKGASYFVREYAIRLTHPRDLRQLAADTLLGRCERGPCGHEISPGLWIDEGAQIHRRARLVAPAYVGRRSKVLDDTLITRFTTIERDCYIDCGTVIEDSSVLANSSVGIWLDVCHALVNGNKLFSLERDVLVEISDQRILHSTLPNRKAAAEVNKNAEKRAAAEDCRKPLVTPKVWQFGANLIQE